MNDFLKEEYRTNFYVDRNRKALWKIELDIMEDIDRICKQHNIHYSVLGGALIGAIRHNGFIPWDDDMDIGMLREDFEKFIDIAPKELNSRFFLQTPITDPEYYDVIVRIRDKNSTGICEKDLDKNINNGVFVEIYPFDAVNPNKFLYNLQLFRIKILDTILHFSTYNIYSSLTAKIRRAIGIVCIKIFGRNKIYNKLCKVASMYNNKNYMFVDEILTKYNAKFYYEDMQTTIEVPFEYLNLSIPKGYDRCLRRQYGDYMTLPPENERGTHHDKIVYYDPFHPYYDLDVKKAAHSYFNE